MENKVKVNYTIDKNTKDEFEEFSNNHAINKSALVNLLILNWLKIQKNKNDGK